jgi:hypothetical protein
VRRGASARPRRRPSSTICLIPRPRPSSPTSTVGDAWRASCGSTGRAGTGPAAQLLPSARSGRRASRGTQGAGAGSAAPPPLLGSDSVFPTLPFPRERDPGAAQSAASSSATIEGAPSTRCLHLPLDLALPHPAPTSGARCRIHLDWGEQREPRRG